MGNALITNGRVMAGAITMSSAKTAAEKIKQAGVVDYPFGATYKADWNLGEEFVNLYLGNGGEFFGDNNQPAINNEIAVATLEMMKKLTAYMDPEYLLADQTYVIQQLQQGKIAMSVLWADSAEPVNNPSESKYPGLIKTAATSMGSVRPAATLWWDGVVFAKNMSDDVADTAFRVAMEGLDREMVEANPKTAIWLIDGFVPGANAESAMAIAQGGALPYPASPQMGLLHDNLGSGLALYFIGDKDAASTLVAVEAAYLVDAKEAGLVK